MSTLAPAPEVTPHLDRWGRPVRRRGRWTYVSHQWNGPVWRLDGSDWDLERDDFEENWFLYKHGSYDSTIDRYLDESMRWVERKFDQALWTALGGGVL